MAPNKNRNKRTAMRIKKLMLGFAVFSKLSPKSHREFGTLVSRGISLSNNKRRANVLVHRRFKDPSTRNSFENHSTKNVTRSSTWAKLKKNHVGKVAGRKRGAGWKLDKNNLYAGDSTGSLFFRQADRNYLHLFQLNLPLEVILIALEWG